MDPLIGTLVLILLALIGARFSFSTERVPHGSRLLFRTGIHFLVLGFLLGPVGFGLLTHEATEQLYPFLALGLGWVGFHFGLQLDLNSLRQFPPTYHLLAAGQAILSFGAFVGLGWLLLRVVGFDGEGQLFLLLGAAATASVTTPAGIAMVSSNFLVRGNIRDLLFFISSVDACIGILALEIIYTLYRPESVVAGIQISAQPALGLVAVAAGLGAVFGIVFIWLARSRPASEELVLYILGVCALAAGSALQWGLSPLFVSVVMGAVVANMDPDRQRIFSVLERWEKPVYLVFLLFAGALLSAPTPWLIALAVAYAVLRAVAKTTSAAAMVTALPSPFPIPRRLGLGLIPQGGISLAMAVSGVLLYADLEVAGVNAESALFSIIVIGVVVSELTGPFFTVQLLRGAGEISPRVEEALARGEQRKAEREAIRHSSSPHRVGDGQGDGR